MRKAVVNLLMLAFVVAGFFSSVVLYAEELTPQWWSLEFKGGAALMTDKTTKDFLGCCQGIGALEFAFLYKGRYGFETGVGVIPSSGTAVGALSGKPSGDNFSFIQIPIYNSAVFRADFKEDQLLVPYVKVGPDYVLFRENLQGDVVSGVKYGFHTAAGLQILLDAIDELSDTMEETLGVNDVYFTIEARYALVNNFGGNGVDLSNLTLSGGFLFEF